MPTIPPDNAVDSVLRLMLANEVLLSDLTKTIISTPQQNYQPIKDSLQQHAAEICYLLFLSTGCRKVVFGWVFEVIVGVLCDKMVNLLSEGNILHFKASKTTSMQLEDSFIHTLALKIKKITPNMFKMLFALLDVNPGRRQEFSAANIEEMLREYEEDGHEDEEMDLGEFGGDDSTMINNLNKRKRDNENNLKAPKWQRRAGE
ncbi:hypothetical protein C8R48DRAFT_778096 [Suillus tomentosus]|nr:hypothetical protein C8R48DRAFT_778096 [Suillus tomentosus]